MMLQSFSSHLISSTSRWKQTRFDLLQRLCWEDAKKKRFGAIRRREGEETSDFPSSILLKADVPRETRRLLTYKWDQKCQRFECFRPVITAATCFAATDTNGESTRKATSRCRNGRHHRILIGLPVEWIPATFFPSVVSTTLIPGLSNNVQNDLLSNRSTLYFVVKNANNSHHWGGFLSHRAN